MQIAKGFNMDSERELLKGNTPTLILAILKDKPTHGYAIAREIERRTDKALNFKEGTLYPALHSLEKEGLISGEWRKEDGGKDRKVYTITESGIAGLARRTQTWIKFSNAVRQVIEGGGDNEPISERVSGGTATDLGGFKPEPA